MYKDSTRVKKKTIQLSRWCLCMFIYIYILGVARYMYSYWTVTVRTSRVGALQRIHAIHPRWRCILSFIKSRSVCFTVSRRCCITVSAVVRFIFRGWGRRWVKANSKYFYLRDWSVHVFSMFCIVFSVSIYVICLLQYEVFGSHWTTCRAQLWALWTEASGLNLSISPLMCITKHKIFLWYVISLYWYIMHLYLLYIPCRLSADLKKKKPF